MALELRSENPQFSSPRISFSYDLSQSDINEQRLLPSLSVSSSTVDFDFNLPFDHQSSSADDLFSGGIILPIDPKVNIQPPLPPPPPPRPPLPLPLDHIREISTGESDRNLNECVVSISSESLDQKQKSSKSSFWQFKRSNSLNCSNGYARTLCPIPLLSRSSSTGSASSCKKLSPRECHPNYKHKNPVLSSSTKQPQFPNSYQKPPLKRNCYGSSSGNGVRVNPVLNVPSANLFRLGSIFSGKKEKNKKK